MKCRVCGGVLQPRIMDQPYQLSDRSIAILKSVPVLACAQCGDTELEHATMLRVNELLSKVDRSAELEVIRYAA